MFPHTDFYFREPRYPLQLASLVCQQKANLSLNAVSISQFSKPYFIVLFNIDGKSSPGMPLFRMIMTLAAPGVASIFWSLPLYASLRTTNLREKHTEDPARIMEKKLSPLNRPSDLPTLKKSGAQSNSICLIIWKANKDSYPWLCSASFSAAHSEIIIKWSGKVGLKEDVTAGHVLCLKFGVTLCLIST